MDDGPSGGDAGGGSGAFGGAETAVDGGEGETHQTRGPATSAPGGQSSHAAAGHANDPSILSMGGIVAGAAGSAGNPGLVWKNSTGIKLTADGTGTNPTSAKDAPFLVSKDRDVYKHHHLPQNVSTFHGEPREVVLAKIRAASEAKKREKALARPPSKLGLLKQILLGS
ncbi:hypothetical protein HDU93_009867 [Gonapodya sp. JEL0774]|nr:hypothetical protein HDU93_009867 [Gonapodya sp. JEL0774]